MSRKRVNNKLPEVNTLKNPYKVNMKLKGIRLGVNRKNSKLRLNKNIRSGKKKGAKRREKGLIDLTLVQHDDNSLDSYSELNITAEGTFPQLEKKSPSNIDSRKDSQKVSRSLQKKKDLNTINDTKSGMKRGQRNTLHKRGAESLNSSIVLSEHTVRIICFKLQLNVYEDIPWRRNKGKYAIERFIQEQRV